MANTPSENRDKALAAISKHVDGRQVSLDTVLSELDLDSQHLPEIHLELSSIFDIDMPHLDEVQPVTAGDIVFVVLDELAAKRQINRF